MMRLETDQISDEDINGEYFKENKGQIPEKVRYIIHSSMDIKLVMEDKSEVFDLETKEI